MLLYTRCYGIPLGRSAKIGGCISKGGIMNMNEIRKQEDVIDQVLLKIFSDLERPVEIAMSDQVTSKTGHALFLELKQKLPDQVIRKFSGARSMSEEVVQASRLQYFHDTDYFWEHMNDETL